MLCIDPEKCMVIIKYIILHSHVAALDFTWKIGAAIYRNMQTIQCRMQKQFV